MRFLFERRDDGYFVTDDAGYAVAHVETRRLVETNDPNLRVQKKTESPLPRGEWQIHFTGKKLTPAEAEEFLEELAQQAG